MKMIIIYALAALLFTACNKKEDEGNEIVDGEIVAYSIVDIYVTDKDGNNLVNHEREGRLFEGDGVVVEYAGETYVVKNEVSRTRSVRPPRWSGLYVGLASDLALRLGDFEAEDDYHGEKFAIRWNDGTSNEITFDFYFENEGKVARRLWIDGELVSDDSLVAKFVK